MLDLAARTETPKTAAEVVGAGRRRRRGRPHLEIVGGGTKRGIGAARGADAVLSLGRPGQGDRLRAGGAGADRPGRA